jgi:hypothetical protein
MATPLLVNQVHSLSRRFQDLLRLLPDEDPLEPRPGVKNAAPFLFEVEVMLELFKGLRGAATRARIKLVRRSGECVLARAPRAKAEVSYFRLVMQRGEFQLVHGAKVADRFGTPRAPDLCLQRKEATDSPMHDDVLAIWDIKLRGESGDAESRRVSKGEFGYFVLLADVLAVPAPGPRVEFLRGWPSAFQVSGLITNGLAPLESDDLLLEKGICVVDQFSGQGSQGAPTWGDHVKERTR